MRLTRTITLPWALHLAIARLRSQWRSLSAIVGGVLLTAIIGANVPLYTTAVAQVGMVQRLEQQPADQVNIFSRVAFSQQDAKDVGTAWGTLDQNVRQDVNQTFDSFLNGWAQQTVAGAETEGMFVVRDGTDLSNLRMHAAYYDGWTDRVQVVSGQLPGEPSDASVDLEGALSTTTAAQFNIHVGDVLTLDQRGWPSSKPVRTRITALIAETNPQDAYWMSPSPLRVDVAGPRMDTNVLTTRGSFLRIAGDFVPQTVSVFSWRVLFNHRVLPFAQIPEAVDRLNSFAAGLPSQLTLPPPASLNPVYQSKLIPTLTQYQQDVGLLNVFFALLLIQIGGLVLFFLVVIVALVRRSERREVAMLQSRGAYDGQILWMRGLEALIICLAAALVAPFIAQFILTLFAPLLTHVDHLPLNVDSTAFFYAGVTAALALIVLIGTLRPILRLPLIHGGGSASRGEHSQWWQRYYLDVVLILVGGAALLRLANTATPLAQGAANGLQADPLLLLAPALLFIALGSLLLRVFPALAEGLARIFARRDGLRGALAAWQISREPAHHGRIAFLLVLAISVGWFATSFEATVERGQTDQAEYRVGSDVRLTEHDIALNINRTRTTEAYEALPGVAAATTAYRLENFNLAPQVGLQQGTLLAVDPATFQQTAYWRNDLGQLALPTSADASKATPTPGGALPVTPTQLGLWVRLEVGMGGTQIDSQDVSYANNIADLLTNITLWARLQDANGTLISVPLKATQVEGSRVSLSTFQYDFSQVQSTADYDAELKRVQDLSAGVSGWVYFEGAPDVPPQGETRFEGFYWKVIPDSAFINNNFTANDYWRMTFADLSATGADGKAVAFGDISGTDWSATPNSSSVASTKTIYSDEHTNGQTTSWHLTQNNPGSSVELGLLFKYPDIGNIPAVVSRTYAEQNTLQVGTVFSIAIQRAAPPFQVVGIADYFPTLYGDQSPFVVANLPALVYTLNRVPPAAFYPNEAWIRLQPGVQAADFLKGQQDTLSGSSSIIETSLTVDQAATSLKVDPLSLGLIGLLFVAFAVALVLSIVCLLTYTALNAQSRREEFAVLRALGFSSRRVVMSVAMEQLLVMGIAVVLGVILGILLSQQVLPTLALGTGGGRLTPPFIVQVDIGALLKYGLVLLAVMGLVMVSSLVFISRMSLASALRYGEE